MLVAVAFAVAPLAHSADPELRGQWHLDTGHTQDDATNFTPDSSGNGLDAVVRYATEVDGRFDKAFHYTEASLTQTSSPLLRPAQLTTLAWVRRTGTPGPYRYIVAQGSGSSCTSSAYALYTSYEGIASEGGMDFYVTNGSTAYHAPSVAASQVWDGNWHMIAGTFDGATARFYLDGHEVGSGTSVPGAINYSQTDTNFRIGRYGPAFTEPCAEVTSFNGDVDEVRVYGRALTAAEIAALAGETWTTPPPVGADPPPPPPPPPPDTTPPTTTITLGPPEPNAAADYYPDQARVLVTASDDGSAVETRCVIDPQVAPETFDDLPARCDFASPLTVIQQGRHTVYAASRDAAGNVEHPVVTSTFRVLRTPRTTIVEGPSGPTWIRDPLFTFVTPLIGSTFECRIDAGPWSPCSSPFQSPPLAAGPHTFSVRATSPEGAIEVAPPERTFTVNDTVREQADCTVRPVLHWIIGWRLGLQGKGRYACLIGRLPSDGCPGEHTCTPRELVCPSGARCTLTTRAVWTDADERFRQGAYVLSHVGFPRFTNIGPSPNLAYPPAQPYRQNWCHTGRDGARCAVVTRLSVIGDDRPLSGSCRWTFDWSEGALIGVAFGSDEDRILRCSVSMTTAPATPLLAIAHDVSLLLSTPTAGELIASWTVAGGSARAAATRPRIGRSRVTVGSAQAVRLVPRLNAAARKQLRRKKKLAVSVRLAFTPNGGAPVVRRQRVTLRRAARPLRLCEVSKPQRTRRPVRRC
jgi:hypothetical protein